MGFTGSLYETWGFMNLNMTYKVEKCRHLGDKYIYLYRMPCNSYSVLVYEDDDDTVIANFTRFFTNYTEALHYYNKTKKEIQKQEESNESKTYVGRPT